MPTPITRFNRYQPPTPRAALASIAVAATFFTMAAMVVLPAGLEFVDGGATMLAAASKSAAPMEDADSACDDEPATDPPTARLDDMHAVAARASAKEQR